MLLLLLLLLLLLWRRRGRRERQREAVTSGCDAHGDGSVFQWRQMMRDRAGRRRRKMSRAADAATRSRETGHH